MDAANTEQNHPKVDVAINALGRPYQTLLTILSLFKHNNASIDKVYLIIDADTPPSYHKKFDLIKRIKNTEIEFFYPSISYNYYDNVTGVYDDYDARMGIRYQYAWEKTDKKYLFISHNDCVYTGSIIPAMLGQINDHIIIGHLGVCWNCPASWAGCCQRGKYQAYKPNYQEVFDLFQQAQVPDERLFEFRCDKTDFNEKYRQHPWPLPACRVNEWACLVNIGTARGVTVPHGPAVPFGATTYIGDILVDTACEWFHDVNVLGYTGADFPVENYVQHHFGLRSMYARDQYLKRESQALAAIEQGGYLADL